MFDFGLGLVIALLISHVICSGYADITSLYEEFNEADEDTLNFWMDYYNKQQQEFFGV